MPEENKNAALDMIKKIREQNEKRQDLLLKMRGMQGDPSKATELASLTAELQELDIEMTRQMAQKEDTSKIEGGGEVTSTPEMAAKRAGEVITQESKKIKDETMKGEQNIKGAGGNQGEIEAAKNIGNKAEENTAAAAKEAKDAISSPGAAEPAETTAKPELSDDEMPNILARAKAKMEAKKKDALGAAPVAPPKPVTLKEGVGAAIAKKNADAKAKTEAAAKTAIGKTMPIKAATAPATEKATNAELAAKARVEAVENLAKLNLVPGDDFIVEGDNYIRTFVKFDPSEQSITFVDASKEEQTMPLGDFLKTKPKKSEALAAETVEESPAAPKLTPEEVYKMAEQPPAPLPTPAAPKAERQPATTQAVASNKEKDGGIPVVPAKLEIKPAPDKAPAAEQSAKAGAPLPEKPKASEQIKEVVGSILLDLGLIDPEPESEPKETKKESRLKVGVGAFTEFIIGGASQTYAWAKKLPVVEKATLWWAKSGAEKQNRLHEKISDEIEKMEGLVGEYDGKLAELKKETDEENEKLRQLNALGAGSQLNKNQLRTLAKRRTRRDAEISKYESGRESVQRKIDEKKRKAGDYAQKAERIITGAEKHIKAKMEPYDKKLAKYREEYDVIQKNIDEFIAEQNELEKELARQEDAYKAIPFYHPIDRWRLKRTWKESGRQLVLAQKEIQKYRGILMDIDGKIDKIMPTINKWKDKLAEFEELSPTRMEAKGMKLIEAAGPKKAEAEPDEKDEEKESNVMLEAAEKKPEGIPKDVTEFLRMWNSKAKIADKINVPEFMALSKLKPGGQIKPAEFATQVIKFFENRLANKDGWNPADQKNWRDNMKKDVEKLRV